MKIIFLVMLIGFSINLKAQQQTNPEILELKLQLLEAKLKLIEPKISELDTISESLFREFFIINTNIKNKTDSLTLLLNEQKNAIEKKTNGNAYNFTSAIQLNPIRLFGGNFQISFEKAIKRNLSLELAVLGTYVTKDGIGSGYLRNQDLEQFNFSSNSYIPYVGEMFTGYGFVFNYKNYLLNKINEEKTAPIGLYAGPQFMYRKVQIKGMQYTNGFGPEENNQKEVIQNLYVFSGGLIIGGKIVFLKVFSIDMYVGGVMRLSKYHNENGFTKYKRWNNIDYSGILPTAGVNIGILK